MNKVELLKKLVWCSSSILLVGLLSCYTDLAITGNLSTLRAINWARGPLAPPNNVILISIDDESVKALNLALKKSFLEKLTVGLEKLGLLNPKLIILDLGGAKEAPNESINERFVNALKLSPTTIATGSESPSRSNNFVGLNAPRFANAAYKQLPMTFGSFDGSAFYLIGPEPNTTNDGYYYIPLLEEFAGRKGAKPSLDAIINFYGPTDTFPHIPFTDLLSRSIDELKDRISGKVVVIGHQSIYYESITNSRDRHLVAGSSTPMFGVEVHANIIANILNNDWVDRLSIEGELVFLQIILVVFELVLWRAKTANRLIATTLVVGAYATCAFAGISFFNFYLPGLVILGSSLALITFMHIILDLMLRIINRQKTRTKLITAGVS